MSNTKDNYDNFYDSELIVEFLQGVLSSDLHLKIQQQIKASEVFRTYVEGVRINFEKSGKNFEKMEADVIEKKAKTWSKLQKKLASKTTLVEKISHTYEQLVDLFRPNPQLELALQTTRTAATAQVQIEADNTTKTLRFTLAKKSTEVIDFEIFNNKMQSIQVDKIPLGSEDFTHSIVPWTPGRYYAELRPEEGEDYMIRFYIREDLNPA